MKITWYGTASILLTSGGQSILFDPYLKDLPKGREPLHAFEERLQAFFDQKHVFITHGHFDHLSSLSPIYKGSECKIHLTKTPHKRLVKEGFAKENLSMISVGEEVVLPNFTVRAYKGDHLKIKVSDAIRLTFSKEHLLHPIRKIKLSLKHCKYREGGETLFYEVLAEGKRVQIMGSANLDKSVQYPTGADLLILPHQGRSDIDQFNKKIVERLSPKRVVLDHYDDSFPPYSKCMNVDGFCIDMSKTIPTQKLIEDQTIDL